METLVLPCAPEQLREDVDRLWPAVAAVCGVDPALVRCDVAGTGGLLRTRMPDGWLSGIARAREELSRSLEDLGYAVRRDGDARLVLGWAATLADLWTWRDGKDVEGCTTYELRAPSGRIAAEVWFPMRADRYSRHTWHTWNVRGVGGENSVDDTRAVAVREVVVALARQQTREPGMWHSTVLRRLVDLEAHDPRTPVVLAWRDRLLRERQKRDAPNASVPDAKLEHARGRR